MWFLTAVLLMTVFYLINSNQAYSGAYPNQYGSVSLQAIDSRNCAFNTTALSHTVVPKAPIRNQSLICIDSLLKCNQSRTAPFNVSCGDADRGIGLNFTDVVFPGVMTQLNPEEPINEASFGVCQFLRDLAYCKISIVRSDKPFRLSVQVRFASKEAMLDDDCYNFRKLHRAELKNCDKRRQMQNHGLRAFAGSVYGWIWMVLNVIVFCAKDLS